MILSMIAAIGENRELGAANELLWKLKKDLQLFRNSTMGHHILMGRKTWDSIGRPLPGRTSMVLSRQKLSLPDAVIHVRSPEEAIQRAEQAGETELFIIGGGELYSQLLPLAEKLYLSEVSATAENADTWFPAFDPKEWLCSEQQEYPAEDGSPSWTRRILVRNNS
ncbi:MAG: dihydrofolate reductase [Deltaproteobacteria bacterium]|nr:dihydrofolate reductase [Deltaproteobacteria bacterium]